MISIESQTIELFKYFKIIVFGAHLEFGHNVRQRAELEIKPLIDIYFEKQAMGVGLALDQKLLAGRVKTLHAEVFFSNSKKLGNINENLNVSYKPIERTHSIILDSDNQSHESNSEGEEQPPHSKERLNTYSSPTPSNAELSDSRGTCFQLILAQIFFIIQYKRILHLLKCSFKLLSYDISETPSDGRAKNVDVQIYSVKKDAYDSNGSPEYPLQRPSIFPYSSSVISTLATVTEKDGPDPLSPIVSFQEPLEDQGSQQVERRNPEKGMITVFHIKYQRY